ncbi:hypothetical protein H8959_013843 [Pygathrix nigripes]
MLRGISGLEKTGQVLVLGGLGSLRRCCLWVMSGILSYRTVTSQTDASLGFGSFLGIIGINLVENRRQMLVAAIVFISFGVVAAFCCAIVDGVFAAQHIEPRPLTTGRCQFYSSGVGYLYDVYQTEVTCHSLDGQCQLKVRSNTCYCCDLYCLRESSPAYYEFVGVRGCQDVLHLYRLLWASAVLNVLGLFLGILTAAVLGAFKDMVPLSQLAYGPAVPPQTLYNPAQQILACAGFHPTARAHPHLLVLPSAPSESWGPAPWEHKAPAGGLAWKHLFHLCDGGRCGPQGQKMAGAFASDPAVVSPAGRRVCMVLQAASSSPKPPAPRDVPITAGTMSPGPQALSWGLLSGLLVSLWEVCQAQSWRPAGAGVSPGTLGLRVPPKRLCTDLDLELHRCQELATQSTAWRRPCSRFPVAPASALALSEDLQSPSPSSSGSGLPGQAPLCYIPTYFPPGEKPPPYAP